MRDKRGLSTIITALLIILLVLVAIGVVWGVVRKIIREGAEETGYSVRCLNIDVRATAVNCDDPSSCAVKLERTGSDSGEIGGVKLVFFNGTSNSDVIDKPGDIKKLVGKIVTADSQLSDPDRLEVAVYFKDASGKEQLCLQTVTSGDIGEGAIVSGGEEEEEEEEGGGDETGDCSPPCTGDTPYCVVGECVECLSSLDCDAGEICNNGICVPEDCVPESAETTCGGWICGTKLNNCGEIVVCGECQTGQMCMEGACIPVVSVNEGVVGEVWPGETGMYFASFDLPEDVDYTNYYVSYTDTIECVLIANYVTPDVSGYDKTHIAFNFATDISVGDDYAIWTTVEECEASLSV